MSDDGLAEIAIEMAVALGAAFVGGVAAIRLRLPAYLGYLAAGMVLGLVLAAGNRSTEIIGSVADVSVAALLFILALQFPLRPLLDRPGAAVLVLGQFLVVVAGVALLLAMLGTDPRTALVLGCALGTSSIVFASAMLQGRVSGPSRKFLAAAVLAQGGMALVIVGLAPGFASASAPFQWETVLRALLLPVGIVVGRLVLRHALARIEDPQDELSQLTVVAVVLMAVAAPAVQVGLPLALTGLAAGWLVGSDDRARAAASRVFEVREVFVAFFLVGLGCLFNPAVLMREGVTVLLVVGVVVGLRFAAVATATRVSGLRGGEAMVATAALLPLGELAFAVGQEGLARGVIQATDHQLVIGAAVSSLAVASVAIPAEARNRARIDVAPIGNNG